LLIEQAETQGEPIEDPLLLFSVLYSFWAANFVAFNGDVVCDLAAQCLALAEKQGATIPLMVGHRLVGMSSLSTGDIADGRAHCDQVLALYDVAKHRSLAPLFGQDLRVTILSFGSIASWLLGYPEAALADVDQAFKDAREIGHAPSLMYSLAHTSLTHFLLRNYVAADAQARQLVAVAEEKAPQRGRRGEGLRKGRCWPKPARPRTQLTRSPPGSLRTDRRERQSGCRFGYQNWRRPMRSLANTMMPGAVSTKRSLRSRGRRKGGQRPRSIASPAKSR
jgi:hypothetical protein